MRIPALSAFPSFFKKHVLRVDYKPHALREGHKNKYKTLSIWFTVYIWWQTQTFNFISPFPQLKNQFHTHWFIYASKQSCEVRI